MMRLSILIASIKEVDVSEFLSHVPGTFSWPELATTDQKAAVAFYRSLFGWDVSETPIGPTETYSIFKMRGQDTASACTLQENERKMGVPPHWNSYVTVANADESAKKAQQLGATVIVPPFDVMNHGRMAVLQDPTGAVFCVWQAKDHIGAKILDEPGALCWTELNTRDPKAAEAFYTQLFGWTAKHSAPSAGMEYTEFSVQGKPSIGMMAMNEHIPADVPSYWMPYFQVADADKSVEKAKELGGNVMVPPTDIPKTGRFAIVNDPQGAMFAVFKFAEVPATT
jgi:predicted enzyme related to lactoylglutathione lyase